MNPERWTQTQLIALARWKVSDAIQHGHGDYAKTMTRELLRLCTAVGNGRESVKGRRRDESA